MQCRGRKALAETSKFPVQQQQQPASQPGPSYVELWAGSSAQSHSSSVNVRHCRPPQHSQHGEFCHSQGCILQSHGGTELGWHHLNISANISIRQIM